MAAASPTASVTAKAKAAPVQATRKARSRWPAPIFVPTSATSGAPRPKTSGIRRYSSRAPVPETGYGGRPGRGAHEGGRRDDHEIRLYRGD